MKAKNTLEMIEKEIRIRNRETPFIDGVYRLKNPIFIFFNPKMSLKFNKKASKVSAILWIWKYKKHLTFINLKENYVEFQFHMDIIQIDIVLNFYKRDAFEGFFDTPIGHFRFSGKYIRSNYGD